MADDSDNLPETPEPRDDQMDSEQYEHPPGLMPSSEHEYDYVQAEGMLTIYETGKLDETHIKSDTYTILLD
ncbi:hypothetical protein G6M89_09255 [Natronolimnobius sp. AArcel1]|uniref:hypothetical protein n=1 Tax=Natronolimnobius sp. AArcel1 TaxID=1679093 RepID=UPI0013EAAFF4|nr:hypothetical protein [Natronolimnobius sp. AArcel1]NGM69191.1 hypothetical protein [Natronolimnobius sp. AArcel1]